MTKPKRILIIEDEFISRTAAVNIIKHLDCKIDVAVTGKEVLDLVNQNTYDIIFMDLWLPDIDGIRLTKMIRSGGGLNRNVPIIALTVHSDSGLKDQATSAGMTEFIQKPITQDTCEKILKMV